jgi:hypothetical protein
MFERGTGMNERDTKGMEKIRQGRKDFKKWGVKRGVDFLGWL